MSLLSTWMAAQPNKLPPKQRLLERLGRLDAAVNNAAMEVEATLYRRRRRGRV